MGALLRKDDQTQVALPPKRSKPTLVTLDNGKQIISSGRWNDDCVMEWILENARNEWVTVAQLARLIGGLNLRNKKYVRARLSGIFNKLQDRGLILLVEYNDEYRSASAVKIYDQASEIDRQIVLAKLRKMREVGSVKMERYERAAALVLSV